MARIGIIFLLCVIASVYISTAAGVHNGAAAHSRLNVPGDGIADTAARWINTATKFWGSVARQTVSWVEKQLESLDEDEPLGKAIPVGKVYHMEGWNFRLTPEAARMTKQQFKRRAGGAKVKQGHKKRGARRGPPKKMGGDEGESFLSTGDASGWKQFPKSYNFFEKYPQCLLPAWNQGYCMSCWAFGSTGSAGHRLCKAKVDEGDKSFKAVRLSPQYLMSCRHSIGCDDSGYPEDAMKSFWQGIPANKCYPYQGRKGRTTCASKAEQCMKNAYKFETFTDVIDSVRFGAYEYFIQKEIYENGPVTALFHVPDAMAGYDGEGVLTVPKGAKLAPDSRHTVVIAGWGVHNGMKYWLVENSWGSASPKMPKGYDGFFRIRRGTNEAGIEDEIFAVGYRRKY